MLFLLTAFMLFVFSVKSYAQMKYARLDSISMKLMRRAKVNIYFIYDCFKIFVHFLYHDGYK